MTFCRDAHRLPARPCVWCGRDCWDVWQQCACRYRLHPWHQPTWWRMLARARSHERWTAQYVRRHPEHRGKAWSWLRAARLRWHWSGRGQFGWRPDFERLWGRAVRLEDPAP